MKQNRHVQKAIRLCGNSQSELARRCGGKVRQGHVWKWLKMVTLTPEAAVLIHEATGGKVSKYEMRPDMFGTAPVAANAPQAKAAA
jgi:DNA-binding transcriptional regulator YdaS (Cro superfamily)